MIAPVAAAVRLIGQDQTVNKPSGAIRKQKRPILASRFQFLFSTPPDALCCHMVPPLDFLCGYLFFNVGCAATAVNNPLNRDGLASVRPFQTIDELLTVTPDDVIAALAIVTAMLIGMRLLYGAWPWESRRTWYRTKPIVPAPTPPEPNSKATENLADTENDHFDRKLIAAE